jgi:steroid delta-isomerase
MVPAELVKDAVAAYVRGFSEKDREGYVAAFTEDAVQTDPVGGPSNQGIAAIGAFWDVVFGLCDSIEFDQRELYINNNQGALVFSLVQHRKDGSQVSLDGVDVFVVDGAGKIESVTGHPGPPRSV